MASRKPKKIYLRREWSIKLNATEFQVEHREWTTGFGKNEGLQ